MSDGNITDRIKRALAAMSAEDFLSATKDLLELPGSAKQALLGQTFGRALPTSFAQFPAREVDEHGV